ncbi:MAG: ATP-binding protein, partial [bacterium]|nr:ATP-binding protein [bacterium]
MIEQRLRELWDQLRGRKPHVPHFLSEIRLQGLRGIKHLRVAIDFPVSVLAGGNATGKSTVLFAAACAYKVPGAGVKDFVPSTLFPNYRPKSGGRVDSSGEVIIEFDYATPEGSRSMRWRRVKGWNRSFLGRKGATQPERPLYLRTLSNLSNPSEVRGILSMSRSAVAPSESRL